jgi:Heparinase II/III-like protein
MLKRARPQAKLPTGSRLFADAGTAFLQSGDLYVQVDAGPFGWGGAGHSHADTLSLVASYRGEPIFTDPGTFTYMGSPEERDRFRGTRAHNTITIDGKNQAQTVGPFRWALKPDVKLNAFAAGDDGGSLDALCEYGGFRHRRRICLQDRRLLVLDEIAGPPGEHMVEQVWNLGSAADRVHLTFSAPVEQTTAEFSCAYGVKAGSPARVVMVKGQLPIAIAMCLDTRQSEEVTAESVMQVFDNEETRLRS